MKGTNKIKIHTYSAVILYEDAASLGKLISEAIAKHKKAPAGYIAVGQPVEYREGPPESGELVLYFEP